jgi:hypothetical protein
MSWTAKAKVVEHGAKELGQDPGDISTLEE